MSKYRKVLAATAGAALATSGLIGLSTPAAATPADPHTTVDGTPVAGTVLTWEEPIAGQSAEIKFADSEISARSTSLSPYLAEIIGGAKQVRTVEIQADALVPSLRAESVAIELFDDVALTLETTAAPSRGAAADRLTSRVYSAAGETSAAIISLIDGDVHGAFWQGAKRYGIKPLGDGQHLVFEDGRTFPDEAAPLVPEAEADPRPAPSPPLAPNAQSTPVIDIMVAFDNHALTMFGTVNAVEAEILDMVNLTNVVYANSQADVQVALTNILALNYTPNAVDGTDDDQVYLRAIRDKNDQIVDVIHTERDANSADLVAVISDMSGNCGLGYLPVSADPAELSAYTLTDGGCAVGNLTFPHEVGHNLCAHHDPDNVASNACGPDAYAHLSPSENLRTVMAYANAANGCSGCVRIPYFSNPDVAYNGWTTGILGARDNSRVIGSHAPAVAAYRTPGGTTPPAPCRVDYTISNTWPGNVQVDLVVENTTNVWLNGWTAEWTFTGDENVYNSWGVSITPAGGQVTAVGAGFGASIPPNSSVTVGFQATVSGTPTTPTPISCTD